MPLLENGRIIADPYTDVADDAPLPEGKAAVISADRLLKQPVLMAPHQPPHQAPLAVRWPNTRDIAELAPYLPGLAAVFLQWPVFRDGRAYSQARLLRQRHGYTGDIRATGNILQDQILFLHRCGVTSFELAKEADIAAALAAGQRYSVFTQAVDADRPTLFERRRARLAAAAD
jgi:uncharacterized protein (DUF934 family)